MGDLLRTRGRGALALGCIAIALPLLLVGCPKAAGECRSDADCGVGEYCDAASQFCVQTVGGPDGDVDGGSCPSGCEDWEECAGDVCAPRYSGLAITEPVSGNQTAGAMVTVKAVLTLADGRTANPPDELTLEVTDPGSDTPTTHPLAKSGEEYVGTFTLGTAEGAYQLVAKYADAALESPKVTLTVDATAPTFEIEVTPAPARPAAMDGTTYGDPDSAFQAAYRRDEVIEVHVSSTADDVDPASVKLGAQFGNGAAASAFDVMLADSSECGGAAYCGKVMLNAWEPEMKEFRDTLALTVDGKDVAGNASEQATGAVKVTRWKWVHQVDTNPVKASPAIASDGTIIVGSTNSSTTGKLQAIHPDGTLRWERTDLGAIDASAAIGASDTIYVAGRTSGGVTVAALDLIISGNEIVTCGPYSGSVEASPAVMEMPFGTETGTDGAAFVLNDSSTGSIVGVRPGGMKASTKCFRVDTIGNSRPESSVVASSADIFFPSGTKLQSVTYKGSGLQPIWDLHAGWMASSGVSPHGLAVLGSDIVGGASGVGALFAADKSTGGTPWTWATTGSDTWNPTVLNATDVLIGDSGGLLRKIEVRGDGTNNLSVTIGTEVQAAPILGEGGRVYAVGKSGTLEVLASNNLAVDWVFNDTTLGDWTASPNLDCARGGTTPAQAGVLYVGSSNGNLYAFIVDSHGIETSAGTAWPKYQHDPRNTGNADTDLSTFACP